MIQLLVARETPNRSDVAALVAAANTDLAAHGLEPLAGPFLARSDMRVFSARFGMRATGFGVMHIRGDEVAELIHVFIDVPARKRGMGRAVVDVLERTAWDEGARRVRVVVPPAFSDAAAFFKALGYSEAPYAGDGAFEKQLQNPKPANVPEGEGIRYLCRVDEVADPGAKGVMLGRGEGGKNVVVVKKEGQIYGYVNLCPHWGTPLEIVPGNFLTRDKKFLFCATHGAKFRMDDGYCVDGPCEGDSMRKVELQIENGSISLIEASYPLDANPRDSGVR